LIYLSIAFGAFVSDDNQAKFDRGCAATWSSTHQRCQSDLGVAVAVLAVLPNSPAKIFALIAAFTFSHGFQFLPAVILLLLEKS